ncbi:protein GIGANTEA-like isoform X1 [Zingiber officinale]|uniref:protein GIGANTEA-like isoform X1 n=1 Tax=Zingiber officinale TaxID=94328 RepID=UPI001C4D4343|nr:protein GIGANTEA-like isoform X1 [Zingiber officinale]XP_042396681.1 protein GIGANTEA-like isoform X1 [Zingiber officinale]XP_042396687.1 protein GIGANTEA-like isoform X1 [Zingiber officinale]
MSVTNEKWIDGLQFTSLFWPPPQDEQQKQAQVIAYVEYFSQFTSEDFPEDIAQLIQNHYPSKEKHLLDEVLAVFILHHPEHGHAIVHPILSLIIDGRLVYDRNAPPFISFISLVSQNSEKEYSEQWALACGEILRILTHYNRPIHKVEHHNSEAERSSSSNFATTSKSEKETSTLVQQEHDRRPLRLLSPWITDILLAAPLGIRSDYFRWCGGVMGKYAAGGELKPPTTASSCGSGKHPQLMPSTPRWAVANGAGVILGVCDEEVSRYETVNLTAAAVPALLLPPPTTPLDEHLVAGLPPLEPYARLFHRYYSIATPSATQRLLLGLLEAPPSWAPDALDAAVQLVELLRAAEDYASGMRLPRNWLHLHFLRAIGIAMSMRAGVSADAAAALLFRILSQPTLLFPPLSHAEGVEVQHEPLVGYISSNKKQVLEVPTSEASTEATAQGIATMLCAHGPDVEWRICTIWEAAYGLLPLSSSAVDLPEIVVATPLQPPPLSWNLYLPLLKVLEYIPQGSPSEACLIRIFVATVEAILKRTFPPENSAEQLSKSRAHGSMWSPTKNLAIAELHTMIHSLFLESCASMDLASRLLFVMLTVSVSHEALPNGGSKRPTECGSYSSEDVSGDLLVNRKPGTGNKSRKKQGPVATFDSYVLAAVCALACELQLFPVITKTGLHTDSKGSAKSTKPAKTSRVSHELHNSIRFAVCHTRRILGILEALFSLKPSSVGTSWGYSSNEIVAAAMVAAHVSELFGRSKACMNALSVMMRCKWDVEISTRASSLYNLIDIHSKVVASIVHKAEPLEAHLVHAQVQKDDPTCPSGSLSVFARSSTFESDDIPCSESTYSSSKISSKNDKRNLSTDTVTETSAKSISSLSVEASDLANFLMKDRYIGFSYGAQALLRSVAEKQELCFSVVSLLWHKLIAAPETKMSAESTSAHQGWRQVVDAICNVVSASPTKASTAIVLQAEKDLQSWIARDDEQGQKMWRINHRIVKLIVELMRNHDTPEALIILASASDLLLRATDGMLVDGEACTLPQLELLEVTAKAIQLVTNWGQPGVAVADGLSNLLKCRLSATIRCLSHPSAHVRALSTSVLRDILHGSPTTSSACLNVNRVIPDSAYQCLNLGIISWRADIEKCIQWEAQSRLASGLTLVYLSAAAKELGCPVS